MALKLTIQTPTAGSPTDVTAFLEQDTWYVSEQYGRQGATAYFVLIDEFLQTAPHQTNLTLQAKPMSVITLTDTTLGSILFSGLVTDPTMIFHSAMYGEYQLQCQDFTYYANTRLVTGSFFNQTAAQIITNIVNNSGTGITADPAMTSGPVITAIQFDHQTLADTLDQISQLVSWQSDYAWYVDYNMVLHWGNEASAFISPVAVLDAVTGAPTTSTAYIDMGQTWTYEWDGSTLRNTCTVRGADKQVSNTDTFGGDGVTTQWTLAYDLNQGSTVSIKVGGVTKTIGVVSSPSPITTQYALYQQPNGTWSLLLGTDGVPGVGVTIAITYTANLPVTAKYQNSASVAQYNGPNSGVFEIFIADATIVDVASAIGRARSEVAQFDLAQERFTFSIIENWPGHFRTGVAFTITTNWIADSQNNWNVGFTDYFILFALTIHGTEAGRRRYDCQAVRVNKNT